MAWLDGEIVWCNLYFNVLIGAFRVLYGLLLWFWVGVRFFGFVALVYWLMLFCSGR